MCIFCKKKKYNSNCYANFSTPKCNRNTPRTKKYLENDLSVYGNNDCCLASSCYNGCETSCSPSAMPTSPYVSETYREAAFQEDYFTPETVSFSDEYNNSKKCCN